jgi:hypothetical protein
VLLLYRVQRWVALRSDTESGLERAAAAALVAEKIKLR